MRCFFILPLLLCIGFFASGSYAPRVKHTSCYGHPCTKPFKPVTAGHHDLVYGNDLLNDNDDCLASAELDDEEGNTERPGANVRYGIASSSSFSDQGAGDDLTTIYSFERPVFDRSAARYLEQRSLRI